MLVPYLCSLRGAIPSSEGEASEGPEVVCSGKALAENEMSCSQEERNPKYCK